MDEFVEQLWDYQPDKRAGAKLNLGPALGGEVDPNECCGGKSRLAAAGQLGDRRRAGRLVADKQQPVTGVVTAVNQLQYRLEVGAIETTL